MSTGTIKKDSGFGVAQLILLSLLPYWSSSLPGRYF